MNLIPDSNRSEYKQAISDLHDTFAREISVIHSVRQPKVITIDANDDYDFTHDMSTGEEEFEYVLVETAVSARVKYIDKQDKEFALIADLQGVSMEFGFIRIKVAATSCDLVKDANSIIVDGNHTNIVMRDRSHGLFGGDYCTFYLQRTP